MRAYFILTVAVVALLLTVGQEWVKDELSKNSIAGCERAVLDRRVSIEESLAARRSALVVARDPDVPPDVQEARKDAAQAHLHAAESRELRIPRKFRVTPLGQQAPEFTCKAAFD